MVALNSVFIYGLNDPKTGRCRYVGKATDPYLRYEQHALVAERGKHRAHVYFWWRKLLKSGQAPILEVLDEVPETEWQFWEREYIRLFRLIFPSLTNHAHGGQGGHGKHSPETIQKIAEANRGKKRSPEVCKKIGDLQRGKKQKPETVAKRKASCRATIAQLRASGHTFSPSLETRAKISETLKGRKLTPEHVAKSALARIGKPLSPEHRAKISAAKKGIPPSVATRAAVSAALKGKPLSSEHRAKISAGNKGRPKPPRSAEHCAKLSGPKSPSAIANMVIAQRKRREAARALRG